MLSHQAVIEAICSNLTPNLLQAKYKNVVTADAVNEAGHCAIAAEAFYHLAGGREAGFLPVVCSYIVDVSKKYYFGKDKPKGIKPDTHWWVQGPKNEVRGAGDIFDPTSRQFDFVFPYHFGRGSGFQQPLRKPSRRAHIIIDRVTAILGIEKLHAYKMNNIKNYKVHAPTKDLTPLAYDRKLSRTP